MLQAGRKRKQEAEQQRNQVQVAAHGQATVVADAARGRRVRLTRVACPKLGARFAQFTNAQVLRHASMGQRLPMQQQQQHTTSSISSSSSSGSSSIASKLPSSQPEEANGAGALAVQQDDEQRPRHQGREQKQEEYKMEEAELCEDQRHRQAKKRGSERMQEEERRIPGGTQVASQLPPSLCPVILQGRARSPPGEPARQTGLSPIWSGGACRTLNEDASEAEEVGAEGRAPAESEAAVVTAAPVTAPAAAGVGGGADVADPEVASQLLPSLYIASLMVAQTDNLDPARHRELSPIWSRDGALDDYGTATGSPTRTMRSGKLEDFGGGMMGGELQTSRYKEELKQERRKEEHPEVAVLHCSSRERDDCSGEHGSADMLTVMQQEEVELWRLRSTTCEVSIRGLHAREQKLTVTDPAKRYSAETRDGTGQGLYKTAEKSTLTRNRFSLLVPKKA